MYVTVLDFYRYLGNIKYSRTVSRFMNRSNVEEKIQFLTDQISSDGKKTYYIIRRDNPTIGLFTFVSVFLGHIAYALEKGYIPIIDMQNFKSIYLDDNLVGKENAWEYYFEQPFNISLTDITGEDHVIYSTRYTQPASPFIDSLFNKAESHFWNLIAKNLVRLNNSTESYFLNEFQALLEGKRILGLLYRGTDYLSLKPLNHPIQPSLDLFADTVISLKGKWGDFDGFYLATDDERAFNFLNEKFPGMLIVNKRTYYDKVGDIKYLAEATFNRNNDSFLKGLEYLSSIILLSACDSIIASPCAGTYAANFFKQKDFENEYFFNLGFY